jgi:hypothetical protein
MLSDVTTFYIMFKIVFPATVVGILLWVSCVIAAIYGYISNIIKIVGMFGQDLNSVAVELIIRGIGVFVAPLGAVAGYF